MRQIQINRRRFPDTPELPTVNSPKKFIRFSENPQHHHPRYSTYLSSQEGLWRARDLIMMGFMGKEECARMAEQQAMDDIRRRRLRKMLKTRRINKGELVNGRIDLVGLFRFPALLYPGGASPAGEPEGGSRPLLIHQKCFTLFDVVCGPSFTQPHLYMPTYILLRARLLCTHNASTLLCFWPNYHVCFHIAARPARAQEAAAEPDT